MTVQALPRPSYNISPAEHEPGIKRNDIIRRFKEASAGINGCVHSLIEQQAETTPGSVAVQFEHQQSLTYQELNSTSNAVARQLGPVSGTIIPILIPRSINLIIALLAVLKAGASYVLLSPESPLSRNQFIVQDTGASMVIVDQDSLGWLGEAEVSIEELVSHTREMAPRYHKDLSIYQDSSDLAYIIYTSGTTGKPKGVMLSHRAAFAGLRANPAIGKSEPPLRQLLCHSPTFSAAQRTILGTLCRGGTLCIASKDNLTLHLSDIISSMGISSLEITPSMLKLISAVPMAVKRIVLGGEVVSPSLVDQWASKVELWSAFGLSEVTQLNFRQRLLPGQSSQKIGKPVDGTIFYVLTIGGLERVKRGELCLGGIQLANGYINLPEKTAEAFIPNPFGEGRIYRTGDMVEVTEDGSVELIGRIDQQVKVDGQRVEPNESNSIIETQPGVLFSCVISAMAFNRQALIAVIVKQSGTDWPSLIKTIRSNLRLLLPSYAIPKYWVEQETLPLNINGKVDIRRLSQIVESMDPRSLLVTPPKTPSISSPQALDSASEAETTLIAVVASTLSIPIGSVSLEASFQELGGSSLDAILVASHLRKADVHLNVADILQSESLRQMAASRKDISARLTLVPRSFSLVPKDMNMDLTGLEDVYPASPLQEGILADSILGRSNYVYRRVYQLNGVSPSLLRTAILKVIKQSKILRTTFIPWKRGFVQRVHQTIEFPWTTTTTKNIEEYLRNPAGEGMALDGPLLRAAVLNGEYLILEMHHALFDFWSSQFIIEDIVSIMKHGFAAIPARLQYNSFIAYQQTRNNTKDQEFWKEYLGSSSSTNLDLGSGPAMEPFAVTHNLGTSLVDLSQNLKITTGAALHAIWALTLCVKLQSSDVTFVSAFSGRDAQIDGILSLDGPTLSLAPMRVRLDQKTTGSEFAKNVQKNLWNLSGYAHSGLRSALVAATKPPSFNTMVNYLVKIPMTDDSPLTPILVHGNNYTQYLTLEMNENDPSVIKLLVPTKGDPVLARSILQTFADMVRMLGNHSEYPIGEAVTAFQQPQLAIQPVIHARERTAPLAHTSFEAYSKLNPSKTAIQTTSGKTLSYGDLNRKANSFAAYLISCGVRHGEMIPLFLEKSIETLISILGIIKCGGSFCPLDPANPHDRNAFIIKDVGAKRLVSDRKHKDTAALFGVDVIVTEDLPLDTNDEDHKVPELTPDSTIYAIYTSGSTGVPKGVVVQHSAVLASTEGMIEATTVSHNWRALWVLNYVFDASYYDVFCLFSVGATLCVAPQDELISNLADHINSLEINAVMLTPTITKLINGGPAQVPSLKVLNVCGEKIDVNILKWSESVDVYNGYGPTEATILMTVSHVKPGSSLNSIGYPLKHVKALIVRPEGEDVSPVPHGEVGELCVKGAHLAKEYLNRPEITSKSFIVEADGSLLYRTGDLARWNTDGSLECLGRKDYQIKLNGYRIELGEILIMSLVENAILHTSQVEATVVSVAEVHGKHQLVAFVIFHGDQDSRKTTLLPSSSSVLQRVERLASSLTTISHYMLPALFLPFQSFPTLPSGKANRKALVALAESLEKSTITQYIPHKEITFKDISTSEEKVMRQVWSSVLDEPEAQIGADSVFMALGGDSISAINVVAACRQLSYSISVSQILSNPTLSEQAKLLKLEKKRTITRDVEYPVPESILDALKHASIDYEKDIEIIYPAGPGQSEFLNQGRKRQQFWNLLACRDLPEDFDLDRWKGITKALTERNQILRTAYLKANRADDTSWHQIVFRQPILDYDYQFYETDEEKMKSIEDLRDGRFTLGKPNIRYRVLHSLFNGVRTLCIKVDHGSYDGTLLRIFDDQFKAISQGRDILKFTPFKQFVDWIHTGNRAFTLEYWKEILSNYSPVHNLPLQPMANKLKFVKVGSDVESIAGAYGVTPSTVFQAAYSIAAGHLLNSHDVLVDNLLTGRNADVENPQMVNGTCANFLPFLSHLSKETSIENFLSNTQSQFWSDTDHANVGLQDIYQSLAQDREVYSAKLLYCFQPFDPVPKTDQPDQMSWIVMAQSKVYMSINYALMLEVQKTTEGHRLKMQWDGRALDDVQIDQFADLMHAILDGIARNRGAPLEMLLNIDTALKGMWRK